MQLAATRPPVPNHWLSRVAVSTLIALSVAACGDGPSAPGRAYTLEMHGGNEQIAAAGATLREVLRVRVVDAGTEEPVEDAEVRWRIVSGSGATLTAGTSLTDEEGLARTQLRLGSGLGDYAVRATLAGGSGHVEFRARAAAAPSISSIGSGTANAGESIRISGLGFSPTIADNDVSFSGVRATVLSAAANELQVRVPSCLPAGTYSVVAQLGTVESAPVALSVAGTRPAPLKLAPGAHATVGADQAACLRLAMPAGSEFLMVAHNASDRSGFEAAFQFIGVPRVATSTLHRGAEPEVAAAPVDLSPETRIRLLEREIAPEEFLRAGAHSAQAVIRAPQIGDRRSFEVLKAAGGFAKVTAEVRAIGTHAVVYRDLQAPDGGFTDADLASFAAILDDPIRTTVVNAFGAPSDIDNNGRVAILFTPVVNSWTPRASGSFFAGFFYGNDLTNRTGSNKGEVFYSLVPDPRGEFGDARSAELVKRTVPPVLAHELQHMIGYNQRVLVRNGRQEDLWLDEALAHTAEDLVARAFAARDDLARARQFHAGNLDRALDFLYGADGTSLISNVRPGSVEERGAQWTFIRYLMSRFGDQVVTALTQTTRSGVANVTAVTGAPWSDVYAAWSTSVWADDAPALRGLTVDPMLKNNGIDLWRDLGRTGLPLTPSIVSADGFTRRGRLTASSSSYFRMVEPTGAESEANLSYTAGLGRRPTADAKLTLTVLRIR